ncbi:glycine/D-amino acid oxidase, deaminating [Idiomarina sp. A28L]|uniref:NAD(P)/FAD-dependent oxidoreductase n=1 Tax=Idiomarina sp. A28L TaxID=1036674 RepID=UPI0002138AF5|nr:FAD-dependent oxidoreductase [Idiomarina sp. A28L]EGN75905.1 glycine/D-amino acid oxidase, deaminating [Idiomarina sp. A28L]
MDLKSGYPFWAVKNGLMSAFPAVKADLKCDVVVIGGGITGALIADELITSGFATVVVEQRDIGWGSTSASTALLQYEIDTHLLDLVKWYGEENGVMAYQGCSDAINALAELVSEVGDVDFARQQSLYFASQPEDENTLHNEFKLRHKHGFKADWLAANAVRERYGLLSSGAILTHHAARIDPYRMTYRLLERLVTRGGQVFDRTTIEAITTHENGVTLRTEEGVKISCQYVVLAAGYASQKWLQQKVAKNLSTYAFITDPMDADTLGALTTTMMWESARPYLYFRCTGEGRLLVGGEDDDIDIPTKRDARVEKKCQKLINRIADIFPNFELKPTFSWAGTFAETADGLPFFGPHEQHGPRVLFAMAYGGNGITYSMIGAKLLREQIQGRQHKLAQLFSFERLS